MSAPILIIGSGGREAALYWALRGSARTLVAPGNGGVRAEDCRPAKCLSEWIALATELHPRVVVVGPEAPLAEGIADALTALGIPVFGPSRAAARIETDKAFAKAFFLRHSIPTAAFETFTDIAAAEAHLRARDATRVVIKAAGLCAGKGVVLPASLEEALVTVRGMLVERVFGEAGATVVIEDLVTGEEASVLAFCDGTGAVAPLPAAQDHKRAFEFDKGLNTGGMGAFAPAPLVDAALMEEIVARVLVPAAKGLAAEGMPFVGVLFAGLMIDPVSRAINVLEFNARLGDPETQTLLPRA